MSKWTSETINMSDEKTKTQVNIHLYGTMLDDTLFSSADTTMSMSTNDDNDDDDDDAVVYIVIVALHSSRTHGQRRERFELYRRTSKEALDEIDSSEMTTLRQWYTRTTYHCHTQSK